MLIPQQRLLFWIAAIGFPLALLAALAPSATIGLAALGALIGWDAFQARRRISGIRLGAEPVTRLQKGVGGCFHVTLRYPPPLASTSVTVAAGLPEPLGGGEALLELALPQEGTAALFPIPCHPRQRGRYTVSTVAAAVASPLRFWKGVVRQSIEAEVRVYPDLSRERAATARFLAKAPLGSRLFRQMGRGHEFEKVRDYLPGDPMADIHWRASAKRRSPVSKVFRIEQAQEIVVAIDTSRLSGQRGPDGETLLEQTMKAALLLGLAAQQQGDRFGLLTFSDKVDRFLPPRRGQAHYQACRNLLYDLYPSPVAPDFHDVASELRLRLPKRTLVVILTALADAATAEAFHHALPLVSRKHFIFVNIIESPGVAPLFSRPAASEAAIYAHLGGHLLWRQITELQQALRREGVTLALLKHDQLAGQLISQYMEAKARL